MSRAIDGSKRKYHRKKILKLAKGFRGRRHSNFKTAKDAVAKSLSYAYRDRRDRKADFRRIWIIRIGAACRPFGLSYSRFISGLSKAGIFINRKVLAKLAIEDAKAFEAVAERAKSALEA
ncbi:MAG: 50S ribosomal protein L20 [Spirochaetaceae bacterium]|jgi:large subunit ribosomal protein L20|nr:50S ribosomal protein L20 [Spirochaetaceae bacterium]GMO26512.1 MAG: 50S ribosomal protein L20 [Termitinemataceae bacterium]